MIDLTSLRQVPHRRFNPLTGDWVLVSPHRTQRPWQGQTERQPEERGLRYDPHCYLCPGNERAGGVRNPRYDSTFIFDNDFAAMKLGAATCRSEDELGLLVAETERGVCRVLCFSPRHDLSLANMDVSAIRPVVDAWATQYRELGAMPEINHVQIFENRGELMGCSNQHPHCQIWANHTVPNEPRKEQSALLDYQHRNQGCLFCDYVELELAAGERVVCENEHFVALVPFWAVWPFELMLCSRGHVADITLLSDAGRDALADILKRITTRYDNLFETCFPYTMGFHQQPTDGAPHPEWHLHAHYLPPLLRSATIRKFMVGYELLDAPQRDITPENAAERLRSVSEQHYRNEKPSADNGGHPDTGGDGN
jgi:UDPglucose--hexose-1-phosphate uridylyltransferase